MERKRIGAIVALAVAATVSPLVYQYIIQPRTEASDVSISILDIQYNDDLSTPEATAFNLYLKLENNRDNDVILSPLQLDVYFHDTESLEERYRLIGEFQTFIDYVIPAESFVASELTDQGLSDRVDNNDEDGYNEGKQITGLLKLYDTDGFRAGTNEALIRLINQGSVSLKLKGNAQFGAISMPFETGAINLALTIWDPEIVIHDVFLYDDGDTVFSDTFVIHTKMRNPSGIPMTLKTDNMNIGLYNRTETPGYPITSADQVGWSINSLLTVEAHDPDETGKQLTDVFLNNDTDYVFSTDKFDWQDVFFAFNLTNPASPLNNINKEWFVSTLLDQSIIANVTLKGAAEIALGQGGGTGKGFTVDMTEPQNYLTLSNVNFYQKYLPFYAEQQKTFTGRQPITMFGNFTVGQLQCNKMIVDTQAETMTLDIDAITNLKNPYRFSYGVSDFQATYSPIGASSPFAWSDTNTSATILKASRWENASYNPLYDPPYPRYTLELVESDTPIPINLTTTYFTNETNAGIFKVFNDLGADTRLLNLTNPFWLSPGSREFYNNPLATMTYLVSEGVNPLTLLNETDLLVKEQDYQPLSGMFLDNTSDTRPYDQVYRQDTWTAMPWVEDPLWDFGYGVWQTNVHRFEWNENSLFNDVNASMPNWDMYYNDGWLEAQLRRPNLYEIIDYDLDSAGDYFPDDDDLGADHIDGAIFKAISGAGDRTGAFTNTPLSDLIWRIYESGAAEWGPTYDFFDDGNKGYFMGIDCDAGERVMFSQNFTLDPTKFPNGRDDIEKVTLSIAYRYIDDPVGPPAEYTGGASSYLLFDWWDVGLDEYTYAINTFGPDFAYNTRYGWTLPQTSDQEWAHYTVDITSDFKDRVDDIMANVGQPSYREYLRGEVSFVGWGNGDKLRMSFDDVVLNVKYKDYTDTLGIRLEDLFSYLEEHETNPGQGNMFDLFNELADNSEIDAMDFWEFIGDDGGPPRPGEGGADVFGYFQDENVSLSTITSILDQQYQDLGVGEPANFLEMLSKSKYRVKNPGASEGITHYTSDGPRLLDDEYWTIEDPYVASKNIMDKLYENIFREDYATTNGDFIEEELWIMLENLGVTMPWVMMYLLTKGWTKDDIFDTLQALGFGSETKVNYANTRDEGYLDTVIDVHFIFGGGLGEGDIDNMAISFDMNPIIDDGSQELFSSLCAAGSRRSIVDNTGNVPPGTLGGQDSGVIHLVLLGFINFDLSYVAQVYPVSFGIHIGLNPTAFTQIQGPTYLEHGEYLMDGQGGIKGLNDAGTKQLVSNVRTNFMFAGETFMTMGGDPVSFFQFLDNYYFGSYDDGGVPVDYSSITTLTHFDVSSRDFINILTGYNPESGLFDENGNGRADDWIAPATYGAGQRNSLQGWGTSFRDNVIFWNNNAANYTDTGQVNGKIIWKDSPDFAKQIWPEHADGDIHLGGLPPGPDGDMINESAPPIVDLIDMLAWISKASGKPEPSELFKWLLGELPSDDYRIVRPEGGGLVGATTYNKGLNNHKTWQMLREGTFNATGFFNWLENDKSINSFRFMYLLNQSVPQVINPADLLFFATSPNMIRFWDGALAFYYHDALDSQRTDAENVLWAFFDSSSFDEAGFFTLLNSSNFDIFEMFMALDVNPASWLNNLNAKGLEPIQVIKRMLKYDPGTQYLELVSGSSSSFNVYANLTVTYSGITLKHLSNQHIADNLELTADNHFANFIDAARLTGANFVVL